MENTKNENKIYCLFNRQKEDINAEIGKAFQEYLEAKMENTKNLENK